MSTKRKADSTEDEPLAKRQHLPNSNNQQASPFLNWKIENGEITEETDGASELPFLTEGDLEIVFCIEQPELRVNRPPTLTKPFSSQPAWTPMGQPAPPSSKGSQEQMQSKKRSSQNFEMTKRPTNGLKSIPGTNISNFSQSSLMVPTIDQLCPSLPALATPASSPFLSTSSKSTILPSLNTSSVPASSASTVALQPVPLVPTMLFPPPTLRGITLQKPFQSYPDAAPRLEKQQHQQQQSQLQRQQLPYQKQQLQSQPRWQHQYQQNQQQQTQPRWLPQQQQQQQQKRQSQPQCQQPRWQQQPQCQQLEQREEVLHPTLFSGLKLPVPPVFQQRQIERIEKLQKLKELQRQKLELQIQASNSTSILGQNDRNKKNTTNNSNLSQTFDPSSLDLSSYPFFQDFSSNRSSPSTLHNPITQNSETSATSQKDKQQLLCRLYKQQQEYQILLQILELQQVQLDLQQCHKELELGPLAEDLPLDYSNSYHYNNHFTNHFNQVQKDFDPRKT